MERWAEGMGGLSLEHQVSLEAQGHTEQKVQYQNEKLSSGEGLSWWAKAEIPKGSPEYWRKLYVGNGIQKESCIMSSIGFATSTKQKPEQTKRENQGWY